MAAPEKTDAKPAKDRSPVAGIALLTSLVIYIIFISKVQLPDKTGFAMRAMVGLGGVMIGGMIYGGALGLVETVLKGIIETLSALLLLANVVACVLIYTNHAFLIELLSEADMIGEHPKMTLAILAALTLFLIDVVAFMLLYPMSKIVGTNLEYNQDLPK